MTTRQQEQTISSSWPDHKPEYVEYRDEGCEIAPACLSCPLPQCKLDEPQAWRNGLRRVRDQEILRLRRDNGKSVAEIARRFSVSTRTIHRIIRRAMK